jgi:hypothetical protein
MSEYEKQANNFLTKYGITFKVNYVDDECPKWCDGEHIHGNRHRVVFSRKNKRFSLFFWNSYHDKKEGKLPTAYDVLASLTKYDPGTFDNFCGEFGYDTDSRKAEQTYRAVAKEWEKVEAFFTTAELAELQEIN